MKKIFICLLTLPIISCGPQEKEDDNLIQLITLDPGHFHAALVQKTMYAEVDSVVHVYAPEGSDLQLHRGRINAYNNRKDEPTHWKEEIYTGGDFFEKMLAEKKGNVVILSGNNQKKTEYILQSLKAGFNVLADKPMAIDKAGFETLKKAFDVAQEKNLLLYDIMTERFEITTILQRELSKIPEIFGVLEKGTPENPAIDIGSGHSFYKYVSGSALTRPGWFMDASQQGDGIVDVTTHLVDLIQWECFPDQSIDHTKDVTILGAKRWPTNMTVSQFKTITKLDSLPSYLKKNLINDSTLQVWSNGEIRYQLKDVVAKVTVKWDYQGAGGDTHYSIMRGTRAKLSIYQGMEQQFKPALYIENTTYEPAYEKTLEEAIKKIQAKYPGMALKKLSRGWELVIPDKYREGHEAHFARVTHNYLDYYKNHNLPAWEVPNMLAKYYTTTQALEIALKSPQ